MSQFRFHFDDSGTAENVPAVRELDSVEQAEREAVRELTYMASSRLPDGMNRTFAVAVSDAAGGVIYRATMVFAAERPG